MNELMNCTLILINMVSVCPARLIFLGSRFCFVLGSLNTSLQLIPCCFCAVLLHHLLIFRLPPKLSSPSTSGYSVSVYTVVVLRPSELCALLRFALPLTTLTTLCSKHKVAKMLQVSLLLVHVLSTAT